MLSAYLVTTRVSAWRNPARCVPPSRCGMLLVKHSIVSWKLSFQDSANSTRMPGLIVRRAQADRRGEHRGLGAVEPFDEGDQPAVIAHDALDRRRVAFVAQHDGHAGVQERQFAQAAFQQREVEFGLGERAGTGLERHLGAVAAVGVGPTIASGASASPCWKRINAPARGARCAPPSIRTARSPRRRRRRAGRRRPCRSSG